MEPTTSGAEAARAARTRPRNAAAAASGEGDVEEPAAGDGDHHARRANRHGPDGRLRRQAEGDADQMQPVIEAVETSSCHRRAIAPRYLSKHSTARLERFHILF